MIWGGVMSEGVVAYGFLLQGDSVVGVFVAGGFCR